MDEDYGLLPWEQRLALGSEEYLDDTPSDDCGRLYSYVPVEVLDYLRLVSPSLTPEKRMSGWSELASERRGYGDLTDLVGTQMVFLELAQAGKVCEMNITCGKGDQYDLLAYIKGKPHPINIKTSTYSPFRPGLRLFVKAEELSKPIGVYVQCFVHLKAADGRPHIHIAGCISTTNPKWQQFSRKVEDIPNTGCHQGIGIPIEELSPFEKLVSKLDDKPH